MHKITGKIATSLHKLQSSRSPESNVPYLSSELDTSIYRFRKQRGVNLGSWFVLERWITDAPFRHAAPPAKSDLDVAKGQHAATIMEAHYDSWITTSDFAWLSDRGFTTVRIPIGYYHMCGVDPSVIVGTDFAEFGDAIETAQNFGLGVLLDLHAAPGKQNDDAHAGTSNPAAFFHERKYRTHTIHVLRTLVTHLKAHTPPLVNITGIELLNEPHPSSDAELQNWYSAAIKDLATLDPALPIYLSDCWKTEQYTEYIKSTPHSSLLVLDHHLYRCFTSSDISTPAPAHAHALMDDSAPTPRMFARVAEMLDAAGAGLVVGEWSGALNPGSLTGAPDDTKNYVAAQLQLFEAHCAGHFFWTYKKQGGAHPDRGWCLRDAVEGGVYPSTLGLRQSKSADGDQERRMRVRDNLKDKALGEHVGYWSKYPGKYKHDRFAEGFALGWDDADMFFASGNGGGGAVSELGFVGAWAKTRTDDHGSGLWKFEHGFKQGAAAARSDFLENYCSK
ncbi:glycoside hydrolase family 5 protein [Mycena maculata]|uniref:Glycoside hydrolase family 5 protein n=1 Tax=Mycena maculata TaxID=230809 RepID=A0AAD7KCQ0_9AGAR|nr:glycoside hydrolase family 5 protein [Mycena maculata]